MALRRKKIESIIEKLLEAYEITEAPVPVAMVAKAKGARIFYRDLEDDVSGFLYRDKSQTVIGINTHHPAVRQNFTAAHELAHLLLHEQEKLHVDHSFRFRLRDEVSSQGTEEDEREANYFAASLLMPERFLEQDLTGVEYLDLLDEDFLNGIARKYGVSSQALVIRLKNLNYLHD